MGSADLGPLTPAPGALRERFVLRARALGRDDQFWGEAVLAASHWDKVIAPSLVEGEGPVSFRTRTWNGKPYTEFSGWEALTWADQLRDEIPYRDQDGRPGFPVWKSECLVHDGLTTLPVAPREWVKHRGCSRAYREWHAFVYWLCWQYFPPQVFPNYAAPTPADCPAAHPAARWISMCVLDDARSVDPEGAFGRAVSWAAVALDVDGHADNSNDRAYAAALAAVYKVLSALEDQGAVSTQVRDQCVRAAAEAFQTAKVQTVLVGQDRSVPSEVPAVPIHPGMTMKDVQAAARPHIRVCAVPGPRDLARAPRKIAEAFQDELEVRSWIDAMRPSYPEHVLPFTAPLSPEFRRYMGLSDARLYERAARHMRRQGLTSTAIATRLGVDERTVQRWLANDGADDETWWT